MKILSTDQLGFSQGNRTTMSITHNQEFIIRIRHDTTVGKCPKKWTGRLFSSCKSLGSSPEALAGVRGTC